MSIGPNGNEIIDAITGILTKNVEKNFDALVVVDLPDGNSGYVSRVDEDEYGRPVLVISEF